MVFKGYKVCSRQYAVKITKKVTDCSKKGLVRGVSRPFLRVLALTAFVHPYTADAEAFQQELHNAAMRLLLRLE